MGPLAIGAALVYGVWGLHTFRAHVLGQSGKKNRINTSQEHETLVHQVAQKLGVITPKVFTNILTESVKTAGDPWFSNATIVLPSEESWCKIVPLDADVMTLKKAEIRQQIEKLNRHIPLLSNLAGIVMGIAVTILCLPALPTASYFAGAIIGGGLYSYLDDLIPLRVTRDDIPPEDPQPPEKPDPKNLDAASVDESEVSGVRVPDAPSVHSFASGATQSTYPDLPLLQRPDIQRALGNRPDGSQAHGNG